MTVAGPSAEITFNRNQICDSSKQQINPQLIETSIFQSEIVGFEEGVYALKDPKPVTVPAKIVEIWRRDRIDNQAIEVITYYDSVSQLSTTKIYYATLNADTSYTPKVIPEFAVTHTTVGGVKEVVGNNQGYELLAFKDQASPSQRASCSAESNL